MSSQNTQSDSPQPKAVIIPGLRSGMDMNRADTDSNRTYQIQAASVERASVGSTDALGESLGGAMRAVRL
jgi:hypothetical protein